MHPTLTTSERFPLQGSTEYTTPQTVITFYNFVAGVVHWSYVLVCYCVSTYTETLLIVGNHRSNVLYILWILEAGNVRTVSVIVTLDAIGRFSSIAPSI